jgi:electron transfer flavoprotein alpha subunit
MSPIMDKGLDIWIWVHHRDGALEEETYGLISEAARLISESGGEGRTTAIVLCSDYLELQSDLSSLEAHGADRVVCVENPSLNHYHGELFARILARLVRKYHPTCILMAHSGTTEDLSPRLAASLETVLVTRAMDLTMDQDGAMQVIRPRDNGYLFERLRIDSPSDHEGDHQMPPIITFLPSVLNAPESSGTDEGKDSPQTPSMEVVLESMDVDSEDMKTRIVKVIEAVPEDLGLEEADIIVAGGRGVGKGDSFDVIHELAKVLGGSVAGTRPVIDWQILTYERQIGQTGKTVSPELLINCGISGANEYTAGIEKSRRVIALNTDPRARIFHFADLGVTGDLHEIIPLLIKRIKEIKER